jgi:recombination protein U
MQEFEKQGGISFIIIYYTGKDEMYYIPFSDIMKFWNRAREGGRKSFTYDEVDKDFVIRSHSGIMVHYLEAIQKDLKNRD